MFSHHVMCSDFTAPRWSVGDAFRYRRRIGTDGGEVPCNKGAMAMISPVFKNMFFKGYKEQETNRCNLDFHSVVISIVVKYCY